MFEEREVVLVGAADVKELSLVDTGLEGALQHHLRCRSLLANVATFERRRREVSGGESEEKETATVIVGVLNR